MRPVKIRESFKHANLKSGFRELPYQVEVPSMSGTPAKKLGTCQRMSTNSERSHKTRFIPLLNWVMLAPSSTNLEERHFVIDSGASVHWVSTMCDKKNTQNVFLFGTIQHVTQHNSFQYSHLYSRSGLARPMPSHAVQSTPPQLVPTPQPVMSMVGC